MSTLSQSVKGYQVLHLLDETGNVSLFRAVREKDSKTVVLKILNLDTSSIAERNRFRKEYQILNNLKDIEGVMKTYDLEDYEDCLVMIMEDLGVRSLQSAMIRRKDSDNIFLSLDEFIGAAIRLTETLAEIHASGIIHKNINPNTIFYDRKSDIIRIAGFTIATTINEEHSNVYSAAKFEGNIEYISPEQTGRINRLIDFRSDLYSLGASFCYLLTGSPPFESNDILTLMHAHIARPPQTLTERNPELPEYLSAVIMKLLAKNADDRYQSAFGLKTDLERCRLLLNSPESKKRPIDFVPGQDDYSMQLHIPQKLYGLNSQFDSLMEAFEQAAAGASGLVLLTGSTGTGKTALAMELRESVVKQYSYFISGKFEQYQQDIPYTGFICALNQLVELILIEPEEILSLWRTKILSALDGNGILLTKIIPDIEKIIGIQPPVADLSGELEQNRFKLTFRNFIQAISAVRHPLVIFIDDLQWGDAASLDLIKMLMDGQHINYLLLIIACREDRMEETSSYTTFLNEITATGISTRTIELANLQPEYTERLIAETLYLKSYKVRKLSELIYEKTQGNPGLLHLILENLFDSELLWFDYPTKCWKWDMEKIRPWNFTTDITLLTIYRIEKYSKKRIKLLGLAACIGNEFDIKIISSIEKLNAHEVVSLLSDAIKDNIIIPMDDYYIFPETALQARFKFQYDSTQQIIYSKIQSDDLKNNHYKIANFLMEQRDKADHDQLLFDIVRHYNLADSVVKETEERVRIAEMNMYAAEIASKTAAFSSSQSHLEKAISLMPEEAWTTHYDTMLKIHSQLAYTLSLRGNYDQLIHIVQAIESNAQSIEDTAIAKHANINAFLARMEYKNAIDIGLSFLNELGITIERNFSPEESINYLHETSDWITQERIQSLNVLPEASIQVSWIYETAQLIFGPLFITDMNLSFVLISQLTRLCFTEGLASKAPILLVLFAMGVSSVYHDISKARLLTDAAVLLLKTKYSSYNLFHQLSITIGAFLTHQYEHLKYTLPILSDGIKVSLNTGMFENAAHCAWWHALYYLFTGAPLEDVEQDSLYAVKLSRELRMKAPENCSLSIHQVVLNLLGKGEIPWILKDDKYNEDQMLNIALSSRDYGEAIRILFYKAWFRYMFRQPEAAEMFRDVEKHILLGTGMYVVPLFYFYDTLANAACFSQNSVKEQKLIIDRINHNIEEFEVWVRNAPMNHQHKKYLMEAEKARLEGRDGDAALFYERAIDGARANEFLNEEALSLELTAEFHLQRGMDEIASLYMTKANECYTRWQAWTKVHYITNKYSQLLDIHATQQVRENAVESSEKAGGLDIKSIIKASQIISGRIVMDDLLNELMKIVIENAGASRGCLLLKKNGNWFIDAESSVDYKSATGLPSSVNLQSVDINESDSVCQAIIRYVDRTHENVLLDDASKDSLFSDDPYIKMNNPRSILCTPLINRGKLTGILYLENNLAVNAFTPEGIEVLELLSGQAAIALENASLFQQAQQEITERKAAELALKISEERFKTIFDSVNDAIFIHEADTGAIVDVNARMCSMYGYTREEALNLETDEINSNEPGFTAKEGFEMMRKTVSEGPQLFEWLSKDKNGRKFWTEVNMRLASIDGQDRILVVSRDISDRKKTEAQIKRNLLETQIRYEVSRALAGAEAEEEVLDVIMQHSKIFPEAHVTICTFDPSGIGNERDVILRRQEAFESGILELVQTGTRLPASTYDSVNFYNPDKPFISNNIYDDDRQDPNALDVFKRSGIESVASFPLTSGNDWIGYVGIHSRQSDFFGDDQISLYQTLADQGGIALHAVRLREKIRDSQQRLSLLVQQSPLAVIEWDVDYKALSWNPAAERIFGYTAKEALKKHISFLVHENLRLDMLGAWQSVLYQKSGMYSENLNITKDGKQIVCEWFNTPLIDNEGQIIGIVSLVQDISLRKHAEEELAKHRDHLEELVFERTKELQAAQEELLKNERLSALGQLTATVSHELRNPLGVIRSSSFYLKEKIKTDDEKINKHLNRIEYQIDLCNSIVEELLEYTRGSTADLQMEDIVPFLDSVLEDIQHPDEIVIRKKMPKNMPKILIDRKKMRRVITNLFINAMQAIGEKIKKETDAEIEEPEIRLIVEYFKARENNNNEERPGAGCRIIIEDNGLGMDEVTASKALDPLFTTKARGTGLGLSIVKKIMEEHNGTITLDSKLHKGTRAILWLPASS